MEFEIWFSFMMGVSVTALCFFADRAYSDLKSLKLPKTKKKHEFNEEFLKLFLESDLEIKLKIFLKFYRDQRELLNASFETDTDFHSNGLIMTALDNLIKKIEAKIEQLREGV
ncbi:hypothetical protein [Leptospira santarosai]|uniref:Uncharacterized protein n=1 Tax=Leptospira santarosai TaxID=28183 RepID=A0AB73LLK2_9LEPT|nr:hypothetical protein [Leptospira santarosai]AVV52195.1 Uncharacterized protein XB17_03634 [Leptospira santarosai]ONF91837.1 hypothetical protein BWD14_15085 [Leptospira santarosai]